MTELHRAVFILAKTLVYVPAIVMSPDRGWDILGVAAAFEVVQYRGALDARTSQEIIPG